MRVQELINAINIVYVLYLFCNIHSPPSLTLTPSRPLTPLSRCVHYLIPSYQFRGISLLRKSEKMSQKIGSVVKETTPAEPDHMCVFVWVWVRCSWGDSSYLLLKFLKKSA